MANLLNISGHLWNAALLAAAVSLALVAERLSADPAGPVRRAESPVDLGEFALPLATTATRVPAPLALRVDPLESSHEFVVAPGDAAPTVSASRRERQLTAILIADDRQVAVIDGSVVNVGDTLPDGARITAIRSDRVSIIERGGRMRAITLSSGRP